jgi:AraC-like DNA-binding protein
MPEGKEERVQAWRPPLPGVTEVRHAYLRGYRYPLHAHEEWTVVLVDGGGARFEFEGSQHAITSGDIAVLPPWVVHDGSPAEGTGLHKRVIYLSPSVLGGPAMKTASNHPIIRDPNVSSPLSQLHDALLDATDVMRAEELYFEFVREIRTWLGETPDDGELPHGKLAHRLRDLLDATFADNTSLDDAAKVLGVHADHLIRQFSREFLISPHQYVLSKRINASRRLLLDGMTASEVAVQVGFYDQAHLTRYFKRLVGTTPGRFRKAHSFDSSVGF